MNDTATILEMVNKAALDDVAWEPLEGKNEKAKTVRMVLVDAFYALHLAADDENPLGELTSLERMGYWDKAKQTQLKSCVRTAKAYFTSRSRLVK